RVATERNADRDAARPPILVDAQTHVWWRTGGIRQMSEREEHFLKSLAGSRAGVVGHPVPIADMGRVMFLEDVFLGSETDIVFLNSFGMRAAFDGVDLFPPREAAFIRSMAPSRIRVLGTVDPPDGASAIESLIYQCETIKIDGLKLYRTDPARFSVLIGNLLDGFGADHILWGTDTPVIGPPDWQIEAFKTFTIPEELAAQHRYPQLTPEAKNQIFGENAARIFEIDIAAA